METTVKIEMSGCLIQDFRRKQTKDGTVIYANLVFMGGQMSVALVSPDQAVKMPLNVAGKAIFDGGMRPSVRNYKNNEGKTDFFASCDLFPQFLTSFQPFK